MSYIGNPPAEAYTNTVKDTFSGDGSTTVFTLSRPSLTNDVRVVVENVIQDPTVAYGVSGTTLTFTSAPPSGTNNIYVVHLGPAVQTVVPPDSVTITDLNAYADGAAAFTANRASSDGDIALFRKDGSTVGNIGTYSSTLYVASTDGSDSGLRFQDAAIIPCTTTGNIRDNAIDLGVSASRFKDLYLSGGVYLGGTGSANYLDDYEEGTWTPTVSFGTISFDNAFYTKIGRLVIANAEINNFSDRSTVVGIQVNGLPFTVSAPSSGLSMLGPVAFRYISNTTEGVTAYTTNGSASLFFIKNSTGNWTDVRHSDLNNAVSDLRFSLIYTTS